MLMECRGIGRESGGEPSRRDEGFTVGEPAEGLREKQRKLLEVRRWKVGMSSHKRTHACADFIIAA